MSASLPSNPAELEPSVAREPAEGSAPTVDAGTFRHALSRWASGVVVLAVPHERGIKAATATAFSSISLEPPLVMIALASRSRTLEHLRRVHRFTLSLLHESQQPLAHALGGQPTSEAAQEPPLAGDGAVPGALAVLHCSVHSVQRAGDHDMVLGHVERAHLGEGQPLIYWQRSYRTLG